LGLGRSRNPEILLQNGNRVDKLYLVKRWQSILLAAALVAAGWYVYLHRQSFGLFGGESSPAVGDATSPDTAQSSAKPAHMDWRAVDRANDGFSVEMPGEPKEMQAPAYNESGGTDQVNMVLASPGEQTSFAVTWEDNPPVARVTDHVPDRTLNMARDGMLARTQTILVNELHITPGGYPARDIEARNMGGGLLDARLIFAGERLYTLMALFPSANARRQQDVTRFFNSFTPSRMAAIPATLPSASRQE
jgi:hypothetical protein